MEHRVSTSGHFSVVIMMLNAAASQRGRLGSGRILQHCWGQLLLQHWDGNTQCRSDPNCCATDSGPWFNTTVLPSPSTSDIEVRVCADEGTGNEDSPVELIDIYAK